MSFLFFNHRGAKFRIRSNSFHACNQAIERNRAELEKYIDEHPEFQTAMEPIELLPSAPEIAVHMAKGAARVGVGPMAAVAGAFAEFAARGAIDHGAEEAIVENGGDLFIISPNKVTLGIFMGGNARSGKLAMRIPASMTPISVCSVSAASGREARPEDCELATVFAKDGALADAAATLAGNLVKKEDDVEKVLARIAMIPGIRGILILHGNQLGIEGDLPKLISNFDDETAKNMARFDDVLLPRVVF